MRLTVNGAEALPVVDLRLMRDTGPDAFFDDQLDAMISARDDGLIKSIGPSNITLAHLLHALRFTEVACVQNAYHLANRLSQAVLQECTRRRIAFVPFAPLGFGASGPNAVLGRPEVVREAARLGITPAQVALAWILTASPNVLLIPGTSSLEHLRENLAAATAHLDAEAIRQLSPMRWQTPDNSTTSSGVISKSINHYDTRKKVSYEGVRVGSRPSDLGKGVEPCGSPWLAGATSETGWRSCGKRPGTT